MNGIRKSFYTVFLTDNPSVLLKDPGMIPYRMSGYYDTHFVSYIDTSDGRFSSQVPGLDCIRLSDKVPAKRYPELNMTDRNVFRFIRRNRKKIDVLNLYFLKHSMFYTLYYKLLRPSGMVYVKMDADAVAMNAERREWYDFIRRFVYTIYLNLFVDKVSIESTDGYEFMKRNYSLSDNRLLYLPNGVDDEIVDVIGIPEYAQKENRIVTVGRIGTAVKNTGLLLEACAKAVWKDDWRVDLVGPVDEAFKPQVEAFYRENGLRDRVRFVGELTDRTELLRQYYTSKVFCLTSVSESFGIACAESMVFGNYPVLTPVACSGDFTAHQRLGKIIRTSDELAAVLSSIMEDDSCVREAFPQIVRNAALFRWSSLCETLFNFLEK